MGRLAAHRLAREADYCQEHLAALHPGHLAVLHQAREVNHPQEHLAALRPAALRQAREANHPQERLVPLRPAEEADSHQRGVARPPTTVPKHPRGFRTRSRSRQEEEVS